MQDIERKRLNDIMGFSSTIMVQDPVDPYEVFAAAGRVVGLPKDPAWALFEFGDVHMLQYEPDQGALVGVQFAADGSQCPNDAEAGDPDGYVMVMLLNMASEQLTDRADHEKVITALGSWLTEQGKQWAWQYDDDEVGVWTVGHIHHPTDS